MRAEITLFEPGLRPAVHETLLRSWDQTWDPCFAEEFLAWRYGRRPEGETLVAMAGSKCVGLIDGFRRPYRVGNETVSFLEPADWYCLPEHRGVGLKLMRRLMASGPLLGTDLSNKQVTIGPRLKWTALPGITEYVLPVSLRSVASTALRKLRLGDGSFAAYIPRSIKLRTQASRSAVPSGGSVVQVDSWPDFESSGSYSLAPVMSDDHLHWLMKTPGSLGKVFALAFLVGGKVVGATVCRVEKARIGKRAKILHVEIPDATPEVVQWVLAENVARAIQLEAETIYCRASCPTIQAALRAHGFIARGVISAFTSFPGTIPDGSVNLTFLRGDDATIPCWVGK